jgi:DNA-binding HxlR family transcriptional regulator
MFITNRDIEIFKHIANFGMLSTKQINSICFNSIAATTVLRRLRMLEDKKFIQRILGLESQDVLWVLLPKGAEAAGVAIPKRHWSKNLLEHDHKLISLRLNLERSGIAHSWIPEHKIRANIFRSNDFRTAKEKLIPDGLMATEADGKRLSVAIELELTLKNKDKLHKTLSRYKRQDGILGVWYIAPTTSLLNSISAVWNDIGASSSGNKLYLSVFEDVIKNPLNAKVFGHGRGLVTSELWTPRPAHPSAQSVSKQDENREHSLSELSPENHAPNYQDTG